MISEYDKIIDNITKQIENINFKKFTSLYQLIKFEVMKEHKHPKDVSKTEIFDPHCSFNVNKHAGE